jgi:hypothetical protein
MRHRRGPLLALAPAAAGCGHTLTMHVRPGDRRGTEERQALVLRTADAMARGPAG